METNLWGKFSSRHIWAKESKVGPKRQFVIFFDKNCNLIFLLIGSSNINEIIKTVLNLLFFYEKILHAQNSTKKHQKHKKHKSATKQKHKNANKIKNALKKHLSEKKSLIAYLRFCACEEKILYDRNVNPTKLVNVLSALFEQKLVY